MLLIMSFVTIQAYNSHVKNSIELSGLDAINQPHLAAPTVEIH